MSEGQTLIVSHDEVRKLLPMRGCIELMSQALGALARGEVLLPLRQVIRVGDKNAFASMPAVYGQSIGAKVITVFPGNDGVRYESHAGVVLYFEAEHGQLLAIIDAGAVTAVRTAAVSGLATSLLAKSDARHLAILGSGVQAASHLEAMLAVRAVKSVRVWSRKRENARVFAREQGERWGLPIEVTANAESAVRGADIICTTTAAHEPIVHGEWLDPGAHINAVGASIPTARELDSEAVARSTVVVDRMESAFAEAGDLVIPIHAGEIPADHIAAELGEIVTGRKPGRRRSDEITLFKSLGLAVEDLASARSIYERALNEGVGTWLRIAGGKGEP